MKLRLAGINIAAVSLLLTGCSSEVDEQEMQQSASEACTEAVTSHAKHPRGAEMINPIQPVFQPAEPGQGPSGTAHLSVNLGVVAFVNSFGVPTDYNYGCVSYHDEAGALLDTQSLVEEDFGPLSRVSYSPSEDRLF